MVRQEWKKLFHNKILLLVVIAVIAIPSIYTTLFLGSMWDPYGKADKLPVAVVNQDQAVFYEGKEMKIGEELTEKLKEDDSLDFRFTDEKTAKQWLADGKCYMVITIPEDFSANAATVTSENPKKMELSYETNPGTNYIASKMSETAMKSMENSVREKVTTVYAKVMFDSIREAGDGMAEAADGSGQLADGAKEAVSGSDRLAENLGILAESTLTFQNGGEALTEGLKEYTRGVEAAGDGARELDEGAGKLADAAGQLSDGAGSLKNGADTLNDGLQAIVGESHGQSQALTDGARSLSEGLAAFSGALSQMPASSDLSGYAQQMKETSAALGGAPAASDPSYLAGQIEAAVEAKDTEQLAALARQALQEAQVNYQSAQTVSSQVSQAQTALSQAGDLLSAASNSTEGLQTLTSQAKVLEEKSAALADGVQTYTAGVDQAADGSAALASGMETFAASAQQAENGIRSLKLGSSSLANGAEQLNGASPKLVTGANELTKGAEKIHTGAEQLRDGSGQLSTGLLKVQDGADALASGLKEGTDKVRKANTGDNAAEMVAAPVDTRESQMTDMPNNGHAMAPYMMSVGLWVGCIAFSLMYPLNSYSGKLRSGKAWWRSKATVLYTVAVLQALVMLGALHLFDGFAPARWGETILTACVASVAFMSIMYFFTDLFGKAGSFLMLIFMVVQLAGPAGTYPLEVSGSFVPALHGWVPFTYTVQAFRSTISGGESIRGCLVYLLILAAVFTLFTIGAFRIRAHRIREEKPLLMDWLECHGLG